jgi:peptidoglycan hydrolase-like protein with peptidoglycan-binding domain
MPLPFNAVMLAMRLLQNRSRIPELGALLERLQGADEPQLPSSGHPIGSVEWLQESLNTLNGAGLVVDGDYGPATKKAISDYQSKHDLKADGWAGPDTVSSIVNELEARSATG